MSEIAERQDISLAYLEQLFVKLRRAEIVESVRGPGGGYRLARPIEQIRISEILAAVDETMDALARGAGAHGGAGGTREQALADKLWEQLSANVYVMLHQTRLGDVVEQPARALPGGAGVRQRGGRGGMTGRVYLDWNATAPLRPEARAAMAAAMRRWSATRRACTPRAGRRARWSSGRASRWRRLVGCRAGGGRLHQRRHRGRAAARRRCPPGTTSSCRRPRTTASGRTRARRAGSAQPRGHILAMGLANGETGIVTEPPAKVDGRWPHGAARADWLFLDIAQAAGRMPFDFAASGADFALLSAHKLGGPKGVGALVVRDGRRHRAAAAGRRAGARRGARAPRTSPASPGSARRPTAAARELADGTWDAVAEVRNILEEALASAAKSTIFVGKGCAAAAEHQLPSPCPGWKGETQVMQMDLAGFAVSAGSACSSGKVRASRVLAAMGFGPEVAGSAIRVSIGPATTRDEVLAFAAAWERHYRRFRARAA